MEKIKLIALDLDGTLLNSRSDISDNTLAILKELINNGVKIVLSSGRPRNSLKRFISILGNNHPGDYSICFNGALTLANDDLHIGDQRLIPYEIVKHGSLMSKQLNVSFFAYNLNEELVADNNSDYVEFEHHLTSAKLRIEPFSLYEKQSFIKMTFTESKEKLDEIEVLIKKTYSNYTVVRSHAYFIEILNPQASKGQALKRLMSKLKIKDSEAFAFGDNENDFDMIKNVKYGFAMANSFSDHLKNNAYEIAPSNDDEGVYLTLKKYLFS